MRAQLAKHAPRVRSGLPILISIASVLTMATGASALSARLRAPVPAHHAAAPAAPIAAAPSPRPRPTVSSQPSAPAQVARAHRLVSGTLLVTQPTAISARQLRAIKALDGVNAIQTVSAGKAVVDGHHAFVLGVDPSAVRPWTPKLTAASQPLWQSIARGELTASFDMGHNAALPLGATVLVSGQHTTPMRIGAFASVGMAGVDAVMSTTRSTQLGIPRFTGVIVSAPKADPLQLRRDVENIVGSRARDWLLNEVIVIRDAGEFINRAQINTILKTAAGRVGKPYVWGATGPDAFDCSGLVQWSFAHAGIAMPRVSEQQFYAGPHVSYANARPGDLLFWHYDPTDPNNVDHVAIYAGNGMMLVAPHTGEWVEYVPVPLSNLAGVVRVDPAMAAQLG